MFIHKDAQSLWISNKESDLPHIKVIEINVLDSNVLFFIKHIDYNFATCIKHLKATKPISDLTVKDCERYLKILQKQKWPRTMKECEHYLALQERLEKKGLVV